MSADRSRRRDARKVAQRDSDKTTIDHHAEESLRSLVRILAREAARELFAKSSAAADSVGSAEGQT
jgi:hypothetical protein